MDPDALVADLKATGDLYYLAAFAAVVAAGSFSSAAERSGVDKSQLSKQVRALESRLGVRLLHRTTRSIRPTEAGRTLFESVVQPLTDTLIAMDRAKRRDVAGLVRIGGSSFVTQSIWTPLIRRLSGLDDLVLDLRLSDAIDDFVGSGFDLALRLGILPDSTLLAKRLAEWRFVLVASPVWLATQSQLTSPHDVAPHWLGYATYARPQRWRLVRAGVAHPVTVRPRVSVDNALTLRQLVQDGLGLAALADFLVVDALRSGDLVRVLPDFHLDHTHGVYLVRPERRYEPARVSVVAQILEEVVRAAADDWAMAHDLGL